MSTCSNAIKYALAYSDFKLDYDYTPKVDYASFVLTQNYWNIKVQNYLEQDKKRNRDTSNNIKESDCAFYRKLFLSTGCHICKARFTSKNPPILDRMNYEKGHSADNVKPCCLFCNKFKSNKDENLTRLVIHLKNFCLLKSLPMTITDEEIYQILRSRITGGLSQVMHRYNRYELRTAKVHQIYAKFTKCWRMLYICGDIDSTTQAISGNPDAEEGYRQNYKYAIKDLKFSMKIILFSLANINNYWESVMRQKKLHVSLQLQKCIVLIILYLMGMQRITIIV
ncbi:MAG: hypothetical protein EZS28_014641 [Streblomastix strix]|uniref:Uncharacterized protein n=1 Tax=Streblomastix strix TaxID=222440 RepID=A0A5J4W5K3_9EUKA|nr:MAG: hypothetical protein EZS28_014641 [Streblomastix strix]